MSFLKVGLEQLNAEQPQKNSSDDPIAILKVRFAKGEIDKNQYEEALKLIIADAH